MILFDEFFCADCDTYLLVTDEGNLCADCRALRPEMLLEDREGRRKKIRPSNHGFEDFDREICLQVAALDAIYYSRVGLSAFRRLQSRSPQTDWPQVLSEIFCAVLFEPDPRALGYPAGRGACQLCGCTEEHASDGGCAWADDECTICTSCVEASLRLALTPESEVHA